MGSGLIKRGIIDRVAGKTPPDDVMPFYAEFGGAHMGEGLSYYRRKRDTAASINPSKNRKDFLFDGKRKSF